MEHYYLNETKITKEESDKINKILIKEKIPFTYHCEHNLHGNDDHFYTIEISDTHLLYFVSFTIKNYEFIKTCFNNHNKDTRNDYVKALKEYIKCIPNDIRIK